jgi:hypothetical protein
MRTMRKMDAAVLEQHGEADVNTASRPGSSWMMQTGRWPSDAVFVSQLPD